MRTWLVGGAILAAAAAIVLPRLTAEAPAPMTSEPAQPLDHEDAAAVDQLFIDEGLPPDRDQA